MTFLESQKRVNYQSEFDRLQGAKKLSGLDTHVKSRMKGLQSMARKSLEGDGGTHRNYYTKILICCNIYNGFVS